MEMPFQEQEAKCLKTMPTAIAIARLYLGERAISLLVTLVANSQSSTDRD